MQAVRDEIERSNCKNEAYDVDYDYYRENHPDFCVVADEREDVDFCSEGCSSNQYSYLLCKYTGQEQMKILRECGLPEIADVVCTHNDKGFCGIEPFQASHSNLRTIYLECAEVNSTNGCPDKCKAALQFLKDEQGCCVHVYFALNAIGFRGDYGAALASEDLFSACEIEIPELCKVFPLPEEFLHCAHGDNDKDGTDTNDDTNGIDMSDDKDGTDMSDDTNGIDMSDDKDGDLHASPAIFCSVLMIMVSLFSAV